MFDTKCFRVAERLAKHPVANAKYSKVITKQRRSTEANATTSKKTVVPQLIDGEVIEPFDDEDSDDVKMANDSLMKALKKKIDQANGINPQSESELPTLKRLYDESL